MYVEHSEQIWRDFPELVAGVLAVGGITGQVSSGSAVAEFTRAAQARLAGQPQSELPEIQAWRRAFTRMGLRPTQYRCASESLLRRLRREGTLPGLHPLVDLCNAISAAYAIPVAVFDASQITGSIEICYAAGDEVYLAFSGETEQPAAGEVIFRDEAGQAHARRWTNRQSVLSAIRPETSAVLIVAEALHVSAAGDVPDLLAALTKEIEALWAVTPAAAILTQASPRFAFDG